VIVMARLRYKKYQDKQGNDRFDPLDEGEIGGLMQRHIDDVKAAGHTVEIVDDNRKAGDIFKQLDSDEEAFEFLTEPMTKEYSALDDHIASLDIKLQAYKAIDDALVEAGVNPGEFTKKIQIGKGKKKRGEKVRTLKRLDTGDLQGGVPGPYVKNSPTHETRVHVRRRDDGELVPAGVEPTVLGMIDLPRGQQATELVQQKALQLAGMNARFNNQRRGLEHYSDHIVDLGDGNTRRVEGKIRVADGNFANTDNVPSHTFIVPGDGVQRDLYGMQREVRSLIERQMRASRTDALTATEMLLHSGELGIADNQRRLGKLLRSDPAFMEDPDGIYDQMIVTGYPKETVYNDRDFNSKKLVKGPSTIHLVPDMKALKDSITDGSKRRPLVTRNEGHSGDGAPRTQVQHIVPIDGEREGRPLYIDMTEAFPMTQQLLEILPYMRRPGD